MRRTCAPTSSQPWPTTPCFATLPSLGEAVRALPVETRDRIPDVPWAAIAGLRNVVVHEYFRVDREVILDIVENQLGPMADRLREL